jgi:hypothetical protein
LTAVADREPYREILRIATKERSDVIMMTHVVAASTWTGRTRGAAASRWSGASHA